MAECSSESKKLCIYVSQENEPDLAKEEEEEEAEFDIINKNDLLDIEELGMKKKLNFDAKEQLRIEHNRIVLTQLKPGDLIEFKRKLYSHWALYIGNSKIIHYHGNDELENGFFSISGVRLPSMEKAQVLISNYWDIVQGSYAFRNNLFDNVLNPLPIEDILARAYEKVGTQDFNIISNNCEHFAKYCRYGISSSNQMLKLIRFGNKITKSLRLIKYHFIEA